MPYKILFDHDWQQLIDQIHHAGLINNRLRNVLLRIKRTWFTNDFATQVAIWFGDPSAWLRQVAANDQTLKHTMILHIRGMGETSWQELQQAAKTYCASNQQENLIQFATMATRGASDPVIYIIAMNAGQVTTKHGPFASTREAMPMILGKIDKGIWKIDLQDAHATRLYTVTIAAQCGISTTPALIAFQPLLL
jgi:hypothetical protein